MKTRSSFAFAQTFISVACQILDCRMRKLLVQNVFNKLSAAFVSVVGEHTLPSCFADGPRANRIQLPR